MPRLPSPSRNPRNPPVLALLVAALLGAACSGKPSRSEPPVIGTEGGTVAGPGGASVVVPPGALDTAITIRVAKDSTGAPALPPDLVAAGDTYVVTPHGGVFAQPVVVRIPAPAVTLQPNQELKLAKAQPGGEWVLLGETQLQDGLLSVPVSSFSYFLAVTVSYLLPIPQLEPLSVRTSLSCGDQTCSGALGNVTATYTVATNSGQLPTNCTSGRLEIQEGLDSSFSSYRTGQAIPLAGGSVTRVLPPTDYLHHYFNTVLRCATYGSTLTSRDVRWMGQGSYPYVRVLRAPVALDIVEGLSARVEVVLDGGARFDAGFLGPTAYDRAVIDWERSDDSGASWRVVARTYQDEANPEPLGTGFPWRYWSVHHGFVASAADHGALVRVRACYTPLDVAAPPCDLGRATRLNLLQQSTLPSIVDAPRALLVRTGQTASFSVVAGGVPAPTLQWQTRAANDTGAWSDVAGATTVTYTTAPLTVADNGRQVRVVASNAVGTTASASVTVSVSDLDVAPTVITQPASLSVTAGSDAVFAIAARGTEALSYQWRLDGTPLPGANGPVLRLAAVGAAAAGGYSVVVSNAAGTATSDVATLAVGAGVPAVVAPTIVTQPASVIVSAGNTATFAIGVSGSGPLAFQWRKDGVAVPGATSAALTLAGVTAASAGVYSVVVSNSAGSVTSAGASLEIATVSPPTPTAPVITTQPSTLVVMPGGAATLAVAASGSGPLAYQWSLEGSPVAGATGPVLLLAKVTSLEAGRYTVTVTNVAGSVTSTAAQLILVGAPAITTHPAASSAVEGGTVVFSVSASGEALRYQWMRNGAVVEGATAGTFTTGPLTLADSGAVFAVLVYNAAGLVWSQPAVLTVTAAPAITIPTLASVKLGTGIAPNNRSGAPSLSADGRRVAFLSDGTDLVAGTVVFGHAYVRDLAASTTTLVNARPDGGESARGVLDLKLAAGGRFVVFTSLANDLVAGDTNDVQDVFLRDLATGTTTRLNLLPDGSQDVVSGNGVGGQLDISADGRWVLMSSGVNLVGDGALLADGPRLFLRDTQASSTRALAGVDAYGAAALSASGRFVVVVTPSPAGFPPVNHLLVHDVVGNTTSTVLDVDASIFPDGIYGTPSISDDGRYLAFGLRSSSLLGGAAATTAQIVVLDRQADPALALTIESRTSDGVIGDGPSGRPRLSADGRYLLFGTNAPNLAGDPAASLHHYLMVRDLSSHTIRVASRRLDGSNVWVNLASHVLSGDGAVLAFVADMADMVSPTTPGEFQVFVAPRP